MAVESFFCVALKNSFYKSEAHFKNTYNDNGFSFVQKGIYVFLSSYAT